MDVRNYGVRKEKQETSETHTGLEFVSRTHVERMGPSPNQWRPEAQTRHYKVRGNVSEKS